MWIYSVKVLNFKYICQHWKWTSVKASALVVRHCHFTEPLVLAWRPHYRHQLREHLLNFLEKKSSFKGKYTHIYKFITFVQIAEHMY